MTEDPAPSRRQLLDESISLLAYSTKLFLATCLNRHVVVRTNNELLRDWRGLLELISLDFDIEPNLGHNPTGGLLDAWFDLKGEAATVGNLLKCLETMERFDVIDDLRPMLDRDYQNYLLTVNDDQSEHTPTFEILTTADAIRSQNGLGPQLYDAFVIFAYEDVDFVESLVATLESEHGLELCIKDRDMQASLLERETMLKLIAERCEKLIAVISPAFFTIKMNRFFCNFAVKIGSEHEKFKFLPILYQKCEAPRELYLHHMLDYERFNRNGLDFWGKLVSCVTPEGTVSVAKRLSVTTGAEQNKAKVTISPPKLKWLSEILRRKKRAVNNSETKQEKPSLLPIANEKTKETKEVRPFLKKLIKRKKKKKIAVAAS